MPPFHLMALLYGFVSYQVYGIMTGVYGLSSFLLVLFGRSVLEKYRLRGLVMLFTGIMISHTLVAHFRNNGEFSARL